jgi:hypothetical protein
MPVKIGVMHTTALSDTLKEAFLAGLARPEGSYTPYWPPDNDGKYGHKKDGTPYQDMEDLARSYERMPVDLIATSGGLISAVAAFNVLSHSARRIPVVSLIGRMPLLGEDGYDEITDSAIIRRVVVLDTSSKNFMRRDRLVAVFNTGPGQVSAATVGLMVNTNSTMWKGESEEWLTEQTILLKYPDLAGKKENDHAHFQAFFKQAKTLNPTISGIVVSSDPYFFRYRTKLINAASVKCDVKFNFPLLDFKFKDNGNPLDAWDPTKHIADPAVSLATGYTTLGADASAVLDSLFPITAPTIISY